MEPGNVMLGIIGGIALGYGYSFESGKGEYWVRYIGWVAVAGQVSAWIF